MNRHRNKILTFLVLCSISLTNNSFAQDSIIVKYYDSLWRVTDPDNAYYKRKFQRVKNYYSCLTFRTQNNSLYSKSYCLNVDVFPTVIGLFKSYYETGELKDSMRYKNNGIKINSYRYYQSGQLADSILFDENEEIIQAFHYYVDGRLFVHFSRNIETKKEITEAFDHDGNRLEAFIYSEPAEFPGGMDAWTKYLEDNVNYSLPFVNDAPVGKYKVIIRFMINKDGEINEVYAETNKGYGMEEEVIKAIKKSPKWKPGSHLGKVANFYKRQPLTFVVRD